MVRIKYYEHIFDNIMGLSLTHGKNTGVNIATTMFLRILDIDVDKSVHFLLEKRTYDFSSETPKWSLEKEDHELDLEQALTSARSQLAGDNMSIKLYAFRYDPRRDVSLATLYYDMPGHCPIERVDYWSVSDPWRPVFPSDEIGPELFPEKPEELFIQTMSSGKQYFYAWIFDQKLEKDTAYYGIKGQDRCILAVRTIDGKIAPIDQPFSGHLEYDSAVEEDKDIIRWLAKDNKMNGVFRCVPSQYHRRTRNQAFGMINKYSQYYSQGQIDGPDLKELVWGYA